MSFFLYLILLSFWVVCTLAHSWHRRITLLLSAKLYVWTKTSSASWQIKVNFQKFKCCRPPGACDPLLSMPCEQTAAYHTSDSVMVVTFADDTGVVRQMTNGDTHPALRQQGEQGVERSLVYRFLGTTVKDSLSWALSIGLKLSKAHRWPYFLWQLRKFKVSQNAFEPNFYIWLKVYPPFWRLSPSVIKPLE